MAVKPTSKLGWIPTNDANKITEPSTLRKAQGYQATDKPTFQAFNWFLNLTDRWNTYYELVTDDLILTKVTKPVATATANQILGMNNAATATEWKSFAGTAPIQVVHSGGLVTISSTAAGTGVAGYISTGAQNIPGAKTFLAAGIFNSNLDVIGNLDVSGSTLLRGNFEVQGTFSYLNVQDLQVEDKNIELNYGSTTAGATGAGLTILGDANVILTKMLYDPTLSSKWKIGPLNSETEILTVGLVQTVTARKKGNGFVPAGVSYPFSGFTLPADHYWCDGAAYLIATDLDLYYALTLSLSVTTTNASANVTTASTADLRAGYAISGTGIPAGATILSITNGTTFVLSAAATASGTISSRIAPYDQQINPTTGLPWAAPAAGYFRVPDHRAIYLRGSGTSNLGITTSLGVWMDDATAKNGLLAADSALTGATVDISHTHGSSALTASTTATTSGNDSPDHTHNAAGQTMYNYVVGSTLAIAGGTRDFSSGTPPSSGASVRHQHSIPSVAVTGTAAGQTLGATSRAVTGTATGQVITGDTETRPQSKGVNYIIKN